jgi:hypothetical protein
MRYWVFNEEQLERALVAWRELLDADDDVDAVKRFLDSEQARTGGLAQGGKAAGGKDATTAT